MNRRSRDDREARYGDRRRDIDDRKRGKDEQSEEDRRADRYARTRSSQDDSFDRSTSSGGAGGGAAGRDAYHSTTSSSSSTARRGDLSSRYMRRANNNVEQSGTTSTGHENAGSRYRDDDYDERRRSRRSRSRSRTPPSNGNDDDRAYRHRRGHSPSESSRQPRDQPFSSSVEPAQPQRRKRSRVDSLDREREREQREREREREKDRERRAAQQRRMFEEAAAANQGGMMVLPPFGASPAADGGPPPPPPPLDGENTNLALQPPYFDGMGGNGPAGGPMMFNGGHFMPQPFPMALMDENGYLMPPPHMMGFGSFPPPPPPPDWMAPPPPPHASGTAPAAPPPSRPVVDPNDPLSVAFAAAVRKARIMELLENPASASQEELLQLLEEEKQANELLAASGSSKGGSVATAGGSSSSSATHALPSASNEHSASNSQRVLPAAEHFMPVIPKSFLTDYKGMVSLSSGPVPADGQKPSGDHPLDGSDPSAPPGGAPSGPVDVLALLQAPKIAPEVERRAREARRAHISGFPMSTTQAELLDFFRALLPTLRREKTIREMEELATLLEIPPEDRMQLPSNAQTNNVDLIRDLTVNAAKSKNFAFIELNLADMITELVELSTNNSPSLVFVDPSTKREFPLTVRRPRDYNILEGVDECKVVMTGFPPTLPEDKLREVFEDFGNMQKFECKEGLAYAEFPTREEALRAREELHGCILGSRMIVVFPLHDWLKVLCHQAGIDVTIEEGDPISGQAVLNTVTAEALKDKLEHKSAAAEGILTLVKETASNPNEFMKSMLNMENLHDVVLRLAAFFPHLRPLYGNTHVAVFPTRVLALLNLFDEKELIMDDTFSALLAEVESEVEKHGRVDQLLIPRRQPPPPPPVAPDRSAFASAQEETEALREYEEEKKLFKIQLDAYYQQQLDPIRGGYGNVYVVYHTLEEAELAQRELAGKLFSGRTVVTSFLFEDLMLSPEEMRKDEEDANEEDKEQNDQIGDSTQAAEGIDEDNRRDTLDEDGPAKAEDGEANELAVEGLD